MPQASLPSVLPVQGAITSRSSSFFGPMGSACAMVWMTGRPVISSALRTQSCAFPKRVSVAYAFSDMIAVTLYPRSASRCICGNTDANGNEINIEGEFAENGHDNDISHKKGVISMARATDPNSASSQFFICNDDASRSLDGKYAAFGYVVSGMSVVDDITDEVFPKTAYADFYNNEDLDPYYGVPYHYIWAQLGNGAVEKDADKPVIEYVKILDYVPEY